MTLNKLASWALCIFVVSASTWLLQDTCMWGFKSRIHRYGSYTLKSRCLVKFSITVTVTSICFTKWNTGIYTLVYLYCTEIALINYAHIKQHLVIFTVIYWCHRSFKSIGNVLYGLQGLNDRCSQDVSQTLLLFRTAYNTQTPDMNIYAYLTGKDFIAIPYYY